MRAGNGWFERATALAGTAGYREDSEDWEGGEDRRISHPKETGQTAGSGGVNRGVNRGPDRGINRGIVPVVVSGQKRNGHQPVRASWVTFGVAREPS